MHFQLVFPATFRPQDAAAPDQICRQGRRKSAPCGTVTRGVLRPLRCPAPHSLSPHHVCRASQLVKKPAPRRIRRLRIRWDLQRARRVWPGPFASTSSLLSAENSEHPASNFCRRRQTQSLQRPKKRKTTPAVSTRCVGNGKHTLFHLGLLAAGERRKESGSVKKVG